MEGGGGGGGGDEEEETKMVKIGSYGGEVRMVSSCGGGWEEMMLLWGILQPTLSKPNAYVSQSSLQLRLDACGRSLSILQSPSSLGKPGVTGSVLWDSGVVLGKFLEHAAESGMLLFQGKKVVELGSGCGLVGCIAALLGAEVILTDLPDRLRLLRKNIETNLYGDVRGSAVVSELIWGEEPDSEILEPLPEYDHNACMKLAIIFGYFVAFNSCTMKFQGVQELFVHKLKWQLCIEKLLAPCLFSRQVKLLKCAIFSKFGKFLALLIFLLLYENLVLGSDVIYSEGAVVDLLATLLELSGTQTTIILAGELRNDAILEYFLESALQHFNIGRVNQTQWHPDYCSQRVVIYVLAKK